MLVECMAFFLVSSGFISACDLWSNVWHSSTLHSTSILATYVLSLGVLLISGRPPLRHRTRTRTKNSPPETRITAMAAFASAYLRLPKLFGLSAVFDS